MTHLFKKREKRKRGFTLIEILVSASILIMIILAVSSIYLSISNSQKKISDESFVYADLEVFLRIFSNAIRSAEISDGSNSCGIGYNKFFNSEYGHDINFLMSGVCNTISRAENGSIYGIFFTNQYMSGWQSLISSNTNIVDFKFIIEDEISSGQPIVTVFIGASPKDDPNNKIKIQASVSVDY